MVRTSASVQEQAADMRILDRGVTFAGTSGEFAADEEELAYAIYEFAVPFQYEVHSVDYTLAAEPVGDVWICVSEYTFSIEGDYARWAASPGAGMQGSINLGGKAQRYSTGSMFVAVIGFQSSFTLETVSVDSAEAFPGWVRTYGNAPGLEMGTQLELDGETNVYTGGDYFPSDEFPDRTDHGRVGLLKYNEDGDLLAAQQLYIPDAETTSETTFLSRLLVSTAGDVYAVLNHNDAEFNTRLVLVRLDSDLEVIWARTAAGFPDLRATDLAFDPSGNLVLSGTFSGAEQSEFMLLKLTSDGDLLWGQSAFVSGFNAVDGRVSVDPGGVIHASGGYATQPQDGFKWFMCRHTADGTASWGKAWTAPGAGVATAVGFTEAGDTVVAGREPEDGDLLEPWRELLVFKLNAAGNLTKAIGFSGFGESPVQRIISHPGFSFFSLEVIEGLHPDTKLGRRTFNDAALSYLAGFNFTSHIGGEIEEGPTGFFYHSTVLAADGNSYLPEMTHVGGGTGSIDITADITLTDVTVESLEGSPLTLVDEPKLIAESLPGIDNHTAEGQSNDFLTIRFNPGA